ncbi:MAG: hypothetical protein IJD00_05115, partial [Clostridia bacterium]|nr:hypothetical protein [Clostridia bacterium]
LYFLKQSTGLLFLTACSNPFLHIKNKTQHQKALSFIGTLKGILSRRYPRLSPRFACCRAYQTVHWTVCLNGLFESLSK